MRRELSWGRCVLALGSVALVTGCPPDEEKDAGPGEEICLAQSDCDTGLYCYLGKCVTEIPRPDASASDGAVAADAGSGDAGRADAGRRDAGRADAGRADAGRPDAGSPDTGVGDAGSPDTGRPDAGRPDSARPRDAAVTDRGECYCSGRQTCDPDAGGCLEPTVCVEDRDCLSGRFCVWGSCGDVQPECRHDGECGDGICVQAYLQCRPTTCNEDVQCPGAEVCRDGACKQCRDESHCPGTQQCSSQGTCIESGTCLGNEDCTPPRECVDTTCREPDCAALSADCPAGAWCDAFEPNQSIFAPKPITPGTHHVTLCFTDEDWFSFTSTDGDGLLALATLEDPVVGVAQFELFNQMQMKVMGAAQDAKTLRLTKDRLTGTTHYLRLASLSGAMQRVEVFLELVAGGYCTPDSSEPNDFRAEAVTVTPSTLGQGDGPAITLCPGDEDWFKGTVPVGKTLDVTVLVAQGNGPAVALYGGPHLDLLLLDSSLDANKVLTVHDPLGFELRIYRQDPTVYEWVTVLFHVSD